MKGVILVLMLSVPSLANCSSYFDDMLNNDPALSSLIALSGKYIGDPGHYKSCTKLDDAKYTLVSIKYSQSKIYLGFCLPSSCSTKEIKSGIKSILAKADKKHVLNLSSTEVIESEKYSNQSFSFSFYFVSFLFLLYLLIILYASYLHKINSSDPESNMQGLQSFLLNFAFQINYAKATETTDKDDSLLFFSGLRFYFANLIVFYHLLSFTYRGPFININQAIDYSTDFSHKFITIVTYYVDGFFVFSGVFLALTLIPDIKRKQGKFSWSWFIVKRFIRYSPVYFSVITFYFFIFSYLGSGPVWPLNLKVMGDCGSWYWNYFYIQNFTSGDKLCCMTYTWYIAVEFQFFIIAPVFILLYLKNKNLGYFSMILGLMQNFIYSAVASDKNDYSPTYRYGYGDEHQSANFNFKPFTRISAFIVGIAVGLLYKKFKDLQTDNGKIGKNQVFSDKVENFFIELVNMQEVRRGFYLAGLALMALVNFLPYDLDENGEDAWTKKQKVLFLTFYRFAFALGLGFCILPMMMGHGNPVRTFLSIKFFQIFGRLSYSLYVCHIPIVVFFLYNRSGPLVIENFFIVLCGLNVAFIGNFVALMVSTMIELPFISIEKKYLRN